MFRKSALAMAMLGALSTGNAVALGLGDIQLKSALNQPLNAEVELVAATDAELQELKVDIGTAEEFAAAGIERPLFLTKMRFDVVRNAAGKPVIRITSRDVVREPFLDFLMDISWSKGRLLREYTVLVDPPVTMPAAAPAPRMPAAQSPAPVFRSSQAPATQERTHTAIMPPVSVQPGEYLTQRNDTLWQVAQQVRPDERVSIEQTMLGLLRTNPEAFVDNNINNLKAGYILRIPSREEMTSISRTEAARESRAQYEAWRQARDLAAESGDGAETAVATPAAAADGVSATGSSLQLVAADDAEGAIASGNAELEALQRELLIANEALEAQRRQGEEMSGRLSVLEEQIANMQRLIQLKDDELARLQAQAGGFAEQTEAQPDAAEQVSVDGEAAADAQALSGDMVVEEPVVAGDEPAFPDVTADAADTAMSSPEEGVDLDTATGAAGELAATADGGDMPTGEEVDASAQLESMAGDQLSAATDSAPVEAEAPAAPVDVDQERVQPSEPVTPDAIETATIPGFVDRLLANPLWLGAGAAVLALLGFFGLRRKRSIESEFQESILQAAGSKAGTADSEIIASKAARDSNSADSSSLLSEFAVSDMGSMRNDGEADPLAEADVYLAYGRYQQAEDLITDALRNDSGREDLNLKLLEVYLAAKNQAAFDEHAEAFLGHLQGQDDPAWEKVAEMGRELSPENPLYHSGESEEAGMDGLEASDDEMLAFDAQAFEAPVEDASGEAPSEEEEIKGLDFDLGMSRDSGENAAEEMPDSVEFTPPEPSSESAELETPLEPEFDIESMGAPASTEAQDVPLEFDLEGIDLETDAMVEAEMDSGEGELADLDEVSTKLDLARAYIDMGDPDGAKSILDEVIEEGNDSQKDEARGILDKIA